MLLVRHGQSEFNVHFSRTKVDPGIVDPSITELGREQAAEAAAALAEAGIERLIASPYLRTLQTASIIADRLNVPVSVEPLVRERSAFACDIGSSPSVLCGRFPALRFDHLDDPWWHDHVALGVAETEEALAARGRLFLTAMAAEPDAHRVAVITHWGFIRAVTGLGVQNGEIVPVAL
jgi:broad specificity phosphatase PhoE